MDTQRFESAGDSRYQFDFGQCHYKRGWAQCDTSQDASYFGIGIDGMCHGQIISRMAALGLADLLH